MLRFDYTKQSNGQYNVTVVSEQEGRHSLAGKLVLEEEEFRNLYFAAELLFENRTVWYSKEPFFKFEDKTQK